jgi:ubiquinone/menaquinone biosynthesis C-methylase UbiE
MENIIVNNLWSAKASNSDLENRKYTAWMNHPVIENQYINARISGDSRLNWVEYVRKKYIKNKLNYGLNLGCGEGSLERYCILTQMCEKFDAFDLAEGAIEIAKLKANQSGISQKINYTATDINKIHLDKKYNIAFCSASAHHFQKLEHIFDEVKKTLNGLFILNEYIGPKQFQFTDKQLQIMNDLLKLLPSDYKRCISTGLLKQRIERISLECMNHYDPSEAIRSNEIIPRLSDRFNIIEKIDYGGTILHLLLQDIVGNFNEHIEKDVAILKLLCYIEEILIKENIIKSDFAVIIAR